VDSVKVKSFFPTGKFGMGIAAPDPFKGTLVVAPEVTYINVAVPV
jgi:hypothetical protein